MKIVERDIYNQKADVLICESVTKEMGNKIIFLLTKETGYKTTFYQLVSDEYELKGDK